MKSQATKAIALSGSAAILVLAVGFGSGDLSPNGATTTRSSSTATAFRPPVLKQDVSLSEHLKEVIASDVGGAKLLGQAHADDPPCVTDSTNPCPPQRGELAISPSPRRTQTICSPAGMAGQHCYRQLLP